jgi:DNA invertase Pin-like site-specific DNA recombinase
LRAVLYTRCSTPKKSAHSTPENVIFEQNPEVQAKPLREYVEARDWDLVGVYSDRTSGTKERRPGLDQMMEDARKRKFDCLVIFRLDRLARSLKQIVLLVDEFRELGISFVSHRENFDTQSPAGKALLGMVAVLAEFERDIMRERILAGMRYAADHGTKSGKPSGRPKRVFDRDKAQYLLETGYGPTKVAGMLGVSVSTLRRRTDSSTDGRKVER